MSEKRKVVEIPEEFMDSAWVTNKVTIKRFKYRERLQISDEGANMKMTAEGFTAKPSSEAIGLSTLVKAIVEAPWPVGNVGVVADLDWQLGQWLLDEINQFNSTDVKKKTDSSLSSSPGE